MEFRELCRGDLADLERWFNDEETRKRLEGMLPLDRWFESVGKLPNQKNYMAVIESTPIGVVTLETYEDRSASIALLVSPDYRNQGYGKAILRAAAALFNGCTEIHAYIAPDNAASLKCFAACGYVECGVDIDGLVHMVRRLR